MAPERSRSTRRRVYKIDRILREEPSPTLEGLARLLGVTVRTICRDLDFMRRTLGLTILHSRKRGFHYPDPPPPILEPPENPKEGRVPAPGSTDPRHREALEVVHRALYECRSIRLSARWPDGERGEAPLRPFFLSRITGRWWLFGKRTDTGVLVNLPLDAVESAAPAGDITLPSPFPGPKVREEALWTDQRPPRFTVSLKAPAACSWLGHCLLGENQSVGTDPSGSIVVRFETGDLDSVMRLIVLLGGGVRLESEGMAHWGLRKYLGRRKGYNPVPQERAGAPDSAALRRPAK